MDEVVLNKADLTEEELAKIDGGVIGDTGRYIRYQIVRGDTLLKIAHRYNTTVDTLVRINGIANKNRIYAGHFLLIPVVG
jgi:hypothetical protein